MGCNHQPDLKLMQINESQLLWLRHHEIGTREKPRESFPHFRDLVASRFASIDIVYQLANRHPTILK